MGEAAEELVAAAAAAVVVAVVAVVAAAVVVVVVVVGVVVAVVAVAEVNGLALFCDDESKYCEKGGRGGGSGECVGEEEMG